MSSRMRLVGAFFACMIMAGTDARAGVVRAFEFDTPGVLPSSEPDISFFNNTGKAETALYSVSNGQLHQRTYDVVGNASYLYPNFNVNGAFNPAEDFSMEARVKVERINGDLGGLYFNAFDSLYRYALNIGPTGVYALEASGIHPIAVNVFEFHTYRLESSANSSTLRVYVDGVLRSTVIAPAAGQINHFGFGDGNSTSGIGADADWDYVRINMATAVPEPATMAMAALGSVGLIGLLRRRRIEA